MLATSLQLHAQVRKPLIKSNVQRGFEALAIYDYFKAKKIFYNCREKDRAAACFGLSVIYYRKDNPFHQIDSAYANINRVPVYMPAQDSKAYKRLMKLQLTSDSINKLKDLIAVRAYEYTNALNKIEAYERYLKTYESSPMKAQAINNRNALAYAQALQFNTSAAFSAFLAAYPQAEEASSARSNYELCLFREKTVAHTPEAYSVFIEKFPQSPYIIAAEDSIFRLCTAFKDNESYYAFIKKYPGNRHVNEAWSLIFNQSSNDFTPEFLQAFIQKYPEYPFKEAIKNELALAQTAFIILRDNGKYGAINKNGNVMIPFSYESLDNFSEGYA
ncbi:MAG: WG repeat-containing protein, partial [Bacteroidota bacterium]